MRKNIGSSNKRNTLEEIQRVGSRSKSGGTRSKSKQQAGLNPLQLIKQIYWAYTKRLAFVSVPVLMHGGHTLALGQPNFADLLVEMLAIGLFSLGGHQLTKRFFARRKRLLAQVLAMSGAVWLKWQLTHSFARDFGGTLLTAGFVFLLVGGWIAYWESRKPPKDIYLSGARKLPVSVVYKNIQGKNEQRIRGGALRQFVDFIGLPIISVDATTGFLIFGETRGGKTILFTALMKILRYPDKNAVIFDPSSNMTSVLMSLGIDRKRVINANPFHRDCWELNLGATLTNPASTRVFFTSLMRSAKAQEARENGGSNCAFFEVEAGELATAGFNALRQSQLDQGKEPIIGAKELCYFCTNKQRLIDLLKTYPDIWASVEDIATDNDQNAAIFSTLKQVFRGFQPLAECYYRARLLGRTYSLKNFTDSDKILLLGRNEEYGGAFLDYFNGAISQYIITTKLGTPTSNETKPVKSLFILDEFDKMGRIDKLPNVSTEGGKYGMCLVAATQSYKAMKAIYGDINTNRIISSITHVAFLKVGEPETDKFGSEYFGNQVVKEPSTSLTPHMSAKTFVKPLVRSITWTKKTKPLFELGHFKNQRKLKDTGIMDVTVDCDGMTYQLSINSSMIADMVPAKPSLEMEREDSKPQSEDTLHFKPLTNDHLRDLGLSHLIKGVDADNQQLDQPPYDGNTITLNIDDVDWGNLGE